MSANDAIPYTFHLSHVVLFDDLDRCSMKQIFAKINSGSASVTTQGTFLLITEHFRSHTHAPFTHL